MTAIETTRYIRKPLFVDAVKITPSNFAHIASWCQGEIRRVDNDQQITSYDELSERGEEQHYIRVRVHNPKNVRQSQARVGDWLLYTDRGYKVYTERAFFNSFDEVKAGYRTDHGPAPENVPADDSPYKEKSA